MWRKILLFVVKLVLCALPILMAVDAWIAYSQPIYYAESAWELTIPHPPSDRSRHESWTISLRQNPNIEQASANLGYSLNEIQGSNVTVDAFLHNEDETYFISVQVGSTSPKLSAQMANMLPTVFFNEVEEVRAAQFDNIVASMQQHSEELENQLTQINKTQPSQFEFDNIVVSTAIQLEESESLIEQTNSQIKPYLDLGEDITGEESAVLDRLQKSKTRYEYYYANRLRFCVNVVNILHSSENTCLVEIKNLGVARQHKAATIPSWPRQSIFFDLFNSAVHMQLEDRFARMFE